MSKTSDNDSGGPQGPPDTPATVAGVRTSRAKVSFYRDAAAKAQKGEGDGGVRVMTVEGEGRAELLPEGEVLAGAEGSEGVNKSIAKDGLPKNGP